MQSIQRIKASDGTGTAGVATVQSTRAPLSTTILVDAVTNFNTTGFEASMGTPHTFTDPITSETITVISEATCVDFRGHIDSGHIAIDAIAPGFTDLGSEIGDIIIIRPTSEWADNVAAVLGQEHNDDGTHGAVTATSVAITGALTVAGENVNTGWIPITDSFAYVSYDSATRIGVITTGTDYPVGVKLKMTNNGGTIFGYIMASSAGVATVFFGNGYGLTNSAITAPYYSRVHTPQGFPPTPDIWTLEIIKTTTRTTTSTTLASLTDTFPVGVGAYNIEFTATIEISSSAATSYAAAITLSSDASTETNSKLTLHQYQRASAAAANHGGSRQTSRDFVSLAGATTFTMMGAITTNTGTLTVQCTSEPASMTQNTVFKARCAYF